MLMYFAILGQYMTDCKMMFVFDGKNPVALVKKDANSEIVRCSANTMLKPVANQVKIYFPLQFI